MTATVATALAAALALAVVHLFAGKLRFLAGVPRSRWLSAAGGISVAYVFVELLPRLSESQAEIEERAPGLLPFLEDHVYLLALAGLGLFYGVEWLSQRSRKAGGHDQTAPPVFWFSIASFALYSAIIGYLLVDRAELGETALALYTAALGLHFAVNDYGLREHHKGPYHDRGRWLLAASILAGWVVGALAEIPVEAIALLLSFLAGGVVLNVIKEELPAERQNRFGPFALGATGYAALLQLL